ncbi:hypothetical protein SAMN05421678_102541 [Actinopolymorpha cephalotaxi]|uniref:ABC-type Na+ efflux pump permease subunit n=1 Tax=Actinopolymorpha cephalotaxi TaxID=504797 RepID=A0A1I2MDD7_9ACTN|nr:hypothetical protein [Actinopolymorpha cephalotaxi]NYH81678.1 ABC-type Na+ efflux pump permease subunit [Actinopolymorpha cephalotaxi]SFF88940.1 hypothetical protein SAMN05421678_102541 [Actinopolymorpha cephalotaxi]
MLAFVLVSLIGLAAYVIGLVHWIATLASGRWRTSPGWFAGTSALLLPAAGLTYLFGAFAGGFDEAEACALSGHAYDADYVLTHRSDLFPMTHPCDAQYDLVGAWVNPVLALVVLVMAGCLGIAVVLAFRQRQPRAAPEARPDRG